MVEKAMTIRISPEAKQLLELLQQSMSLPSQNSTIEQIIREAAKKRKIKLPETEQK